ncbi:MAG TPA: hypothetical protein VIP77_16230 [Jiangellaceae bacterium]
MVDQLCTPADLASALQQDLDASTATLWVEVGTAVVQEAAGQRIVQVVGDTVELSGTTDSWLDLPQIPAAAVTSVTLDGATLLAGSPGGGGKSYRRKGNRLWRGCGWQTYCGEPSDVVVVYTHGYAAGAQELQLARGAVIGLAQAAYSNPAGGAVAREQIDDYAVAYEAMAAALEASPHLKAALRRQYGRRAGLVRIG